MVLETNYLVETSNLTKVYKNKKVVDNVNLKIKQGEVYGFLGPNGAGKSTTIKLLLGLVKQTKGDIKIFNKSLKNNKTDILRDIGSLVEAPAYYAHLTAYENLLILNNILNLPKSRIDEVLETVKLNNFSNKPVKEFSLGMKQRLGIAGALLAQPKLLILDEPTNGLDPAGIIDMRKLIRKLNEEYGVTIIISSHLLSEIEHVANYMGIIANGRLLFQGSISELRNASPISIRIVTDNIPETLKSARNLHAEVVETTDSVLVKNIDDIILATLIKKLVQKDVMIYRVEEKSQTLEDIFLDLVVGEETLC